MGRLILLFLIVVGAVLFVHWLMNEDPKKIARALKRYGLWIGIGALLLLVATGRLNWLFALVAAAIPFAARLLSLLRYVPILSHLYTSVQNARTARSASGMSSGGASSQVESRFLRMVLEHDTGHMDGEVLEGAYQGQRLSQLSLQQMLALYDEYRAQDEESTALLEAYLDRNHPDWREQAGAQPGAGANPATGPMGRQEASEILGVPQDADRQSIVAAHRKLMQKLHPDRGGSTYLAAKVNQAKDVLLADAD